ncbi:glycosyltransferase family 39 protein [Anaerolineales bacterium HSG24]|nr:glycosyltransferase family 39 protein [Anaerolineales bacterium HSG24]
MPSLLRLAWPILLLVMADGLILGHAPAELRYVASLILLTVLPGWIWLTVFGKLNSLIERSLLAVGLSLSATIYITMLAVYLPGQLTASRLLFLLNIFILTGFVARNGVQNLFFLKSCTPSASFFVSTQKSWLSLPKPTSFDSPRLHIPFFLITLLILLTLALRLPNLGYAEFHEDEAEALMLGVRVLQGEDYALFLHRKGPAQMLLPVAFWLLTERITESMARLPFALSSILSVLTMFVLGRRWFDLTAGLIAGLLWAVNGYSLAFGRMVQYQAVIFFLGPLAICSLYLAHKQNQPRWLYLSAILLATCLLAHFDALLLLPVTGYLLVAYGDTWPRRLSSLFALILFISLVASFYIPYLLDPEFSNTTQYLSESRIKPGLLYNNLWLLRRLDAEYSSWFYLPLLVGGLMVGGGMLLKRNVKFALPIPNHSFLDSSRKINLPTFPEPAEGKLASANSANGFWEVLKLGTALTDPRLIYGAGFIGTILCLSTVWQPTWWQMGMVNMALLPWLILGGLLFWQATTLEQRSMLLMLGAPLIGYGFLVDDPRTHLYIIYPGAVLMSGFGWQNLLGRRTPVSLGNWGSNAQIKTNIKIMLALIGCGWLGLIIAYVGLIYLTPEPTFLTVRGQWDDSVGELIYDDLPKSRDYFGYPKREGWKAIGALRAEGNYQGDFRSVNEDFIVPIWYNYGQARSCYDTPAHFFVRLTDYAGKIDPPYQLTGSVTRETDPRIEIYSAVGQTSQPNSYTVETLIESFDQQATPQRFIQQAQPSQSVGTQFGEAIRFVGYDLSKNMAHAGETLTLNLYWQATTAPTDSYRAFVHLTDGTTLWAQQDDNPICRLPTSIWREGQHGLGQFRLQLKPDMPPGRYPLIIGLYQAETLKRLTITAGMGQIGDDFLWLGDIEVSPP